MEGAPNDPSTGVTSREPLLAVEDLRVDIDAVPTIDGLTMRSTGDRLLVLGCPAAFFEAATAVRPIARGAFRIRGISPAEATRGRLVAGVPLDPPLPPKWTPLEYVTWSARLAGLSSREARAGANDAIDGVQLTTMAKTPIAQLVVHARRGVVLAAAMATGASVLVLEDPLAALPEEIARTWARIVVGALERREWIVLAPRVPLTSPLAMNADDAIVVTASRVTAQGPPAEIAAAERRFVARIHGSLDALGARLAERGARMDVNGAQVTLDLGQALTTAELLGLCTEVDVTIVELAPIARALS